VKSNDVETRTDGIGLIVMIMASMLR